MEKVQWKSTTYTKIKFYIILIYIFFPRMNIKKLQKEAQGGTTPISLWIEYSGSNWFHSNTPNSMYLFNVNC